MVLEIWTSLHLQLDVLVVQVAVRGAEGAELVLLYGVGLSGILRNLFWYFLNLIGW